MKMSQILDLLDDKLPVVLDGAQNVHFEDHAMPPSCIHLTARKPQNLSAKHTWASNGALAAEPAAKTPVIQRAQLFCGHAMTYDAGRVCFSCAFD